MEINNAFRLDFAELIEIPADDINNEFSVSKQAVWDSLTLIGLISLIDKHFNIVINASLLYDIQTYGELCCLIQRSA